jgi:hypothetical protein
MHRGRWVSFLTHPGEPRDGPVGHRARYSIAWDCRGGDDFDGLSWLRAAYAECRDSRDDRPGHMTELTGNAHR